MSAETPILLEEDKSLSQEIIWTKYQSIGIAMECGSYGERLETQELVWVAKRLAGQNLVLGFDLAMTQALSANRSFRGVRDLKPDPAWYQAFPQTSAYMIQGDIAQPEYRALMTHRADLVLAVCPSNNMLELMETGLAMLKGEGSRLVMAVPVVDWLNKDRINRTNVCSQPVLDFYTILSGIIVQNKQEKIRLLEDPGLGVFDIYTYIFPLEGYIRVFPLKMYLNTLGNTAQILVMSMMKKEIKSPEFRDEDMKGHGVYVLPGNSIAHRKCYVEMEGIQGIAKKTGQTSEQIVLDVIHNKPACEHIPDYEAALTEIS